ncbi:unnamed protein product [Boreogadus saida]
MCTEHSKDFVDQRTSSSGGGISAAAQLWEYNPFLCRTVAKRHLPELRDCRQSFSRKSGGGDMEEKGILLPELSCWTAAELPPPDMSAPGGHQPEQQENFGGSPAAQARVARRQFGSSAPGIQSLTCCERARDGVRRSICDS